jgi:hypothetical protein
MEYRMSRYRKVAVTSLFMLAAVAAGPDKMCGSCDFLQAGACINPGRAETDNAFLAEPDDVFVEPPSTPGCAVRRKALRNWISQNLQPRLVAEQMSTSRRPK